MTLRNGEGLLFLSGATRYRSGMLIDNPLVTHRTERKATRGSQRDRLGDGRDGKGGSDTLAKRSETSVVITDIIITSTTQ